MGADSKPFVPQRRGSVTTQSSDAGLSPASTTKNIPSYPDFLSGNDVSWQELRAQLNLNMSHAEFPDDIVGSDSSNESSSSLDEDEVSMLIDAIRAVSRSPVSTASTKQQKSNMYSGSSPTSTMNFDDDPFEGTKSCPDFIDSPKRQLLQKSLRNEIFESSSTLKISQDSLTPIKPDAFDPRKLLRSFPERAGTLFSERSREERQQLFPKPHKKIARAVSVPNQPQMDPRASLPSISEFKRETFDLALEELRRSRSMDDFMQIRRKKTSSKRSSGHRHHLSISQKIVSAPSRLSSSSPLTSPVQNRWDVSPRKSPSKSKGSPRETSPRIPRRRSSIPDEIHKMAQAVSLEDEISQEEITLAPLAG